MNSEKSDLVRLAEVIKDIKFAMLSTVESDGTIYSRPMATQKLNVKEFDGRLFFFTKLHSLKVHSIENDQHVNLAYAEPESQKYASVSGLATISQDKDKMKKLWNPMLKAWFPEGLDDPEMALIIVDVHNAEIWDSPPSKVVQLVGFAKAMVSGKPYDHKAHTEHIDVRIQH